MLKQRYLLSTEIIVVISLISFYWGVILFLSGSVSSGYHFTDDHEIVQFADGISQTDPVEYTENVIASRLNTRYRPFYNLLRIIISSVLEINFTAWHIYHYILAVLSTLFLYLFTRNLDFTQSESLLFSILVFAGGQAEIWWRLGTAETIGIFFLSLALLFMSLTVRKGRNNYIYNILFIICTLFASLSKESFILIIPALAFWKIDIWHKLNESSWKEAVKKNISTCLILITMALFEIIHLSFLLDSLDIGYAGIDRFQLIDVIRTFKNLLFQDGLGIAIVLGIFIIIISTKLPLKTLLKKFISPLILISLICIPQVILYTKSGIYHRYMLPSTIGLSVFIIYLTQFARMNKPHRIKLSLSYSLIFGFAFISLCYGTGSLFKDARQYAQTGYSETNVLKTVVTNIENESDRILIIADPGLNYEDSYSIYQYLRIVGKNKNMFFYQVFTRQTYNNVQQQLIDSYEDFVELFGGNLVKNIDEIEPARFIIFLPGTESYFLNKQHWQTGVIYTKHSFGQYLFYMQQ